MNIIIEAALLAGCSLVDDDLSLCDKDLQVDYELCLVTNITAELQTELSLQADVEIQGMLKEYLKDIFTDYARDVDLSFYDNEPPMGRLEHMSEVMNGSESSYTLFLPVRTYLHTAVANIRDNGSVSLERDGNCETASLVQHDQNGVVQPHSTGLFTARENMQVLSGVDQHFDVRLYMANAATALVLDLSEVKDLIKNVKVRVSGFATEYNIYGDTYSFAPEGEDPVIATNRLDSKDGQQACFVSVHFPSRPVSQSKLVIETDEDLKKSDHPLWKWIVHVTLADDSITESVLDISDELPAGHLKTLKATVRDNGVVMTENPTVGVSVTLDWNQGIVGDIDF